MKIDWSEFYPHQDIPDLTQEMIRGGNSGTISNATENGAFYSDSGILSRRIKVGVEKTCTGTATLLAYCLVNQILGKGSQNERGSSELTENNRSKPARFECLCAFCVD